MKKFALLWFFLALTTFLGAQQIGGLPKPLSGNFEDNRFSFWYYPGLNLGTHINEVSVNATPGWHFKVKNGNMLKLQWHSSLRANLTYLGLPGTSLGMVNKASFVYSFGEASRLFYELSRPNLRNRIEYYFIHYASTDRTNQFSGGITYAHFIGRSILRFAMENDFMAFLGLDEFRTGGGSLDFQRVIKGKVYGIGLGAMLWTGSTKGLANLDFGQVYDMSNQFGADHSHGILFLNLRYGSTCLSLGYDSEPIRRGIQDNLHRVIDDGTIPGGSMSRNRIFIQLSLLDVEFLY